MSKITFWKIIAIIGWILFFIVLYYWLWFPDLEAAEINLPKGSYMLSKHFNSSEFTCKCCGRTKINIQLLMALENLREMSNAPIIITSGYRCLKYNKEVGGASKSQHLYGNAVDIKIKGYSPAQVVKLAKECGFTWTKTYKSWAHLDIRQIKLAKGD